MLFGFLSLTFLLRLVLLTSGKVVHEEPFRGLRQLLEQRRLGNRIDCGQRLLCLVASTGLKVLASLVWDSLDDLLLGGLRERLEAVDDPRLCRVEDRYGRGPFPW